MNDINTEYYIVVNAEGQYSIWPSWKEIPLGWDIYGTPATRQQCLDKIETIWTDMRPNSIILD
jgi:MbtH protein